LPGTAGYASIAPSANATAFRTLTASGIRYEMKM
jgi:hypothetical protein